jgi:2-oxo-4-hydroxy-4-carboxy-5-ureidoimidazoline decarboxylase
MRLDALNRLDAASAARELQHCCGSVRWVQLMVAARPFASLAAAAAAADRLWGSLARDDWLQAFAAHARIGQPTRSDWEAAEQRTAAGGATDAARTALERLNGEYEARFGHMFIVCASGKTAGEILRLLESRLRNNPDDELRVASEEQKQITRLRLARLLA